MLHVQAKGVDYMKLCLSFSKQKNSSSFHFSFFKGRVWLCIGYDWGGSKILASYVGGSVSGERRGMHPSLPLYIHPFIQSCTTHATFERRSHYCVQPATMQ